MAVEEGLPAPFMGKFWICSFMVIMIFMYNESWPQITVYLIWPIIILEYPFKFAVSCILIEIHIVVKYIICYYQANEVSIIRRKCVGFDVKQHEFRESFRKEVVFRFDCEDPYTSIDRMNEEITEYENEMHQLYESAGLFEVNIHDYKQLKVPLKTFIFVKFLWALDLKNIKLPYIFVGQRSSNECCDVAFHPALPLNTALGYPCLVSLIATTNMNS